MQIPNMLRNAGDQAAAVLLGSDRRLRQHVLFVCSAVYFYAVCIAVNTHSMCLGVVSPRDGALINLGLAFVWPTFYLLVRSGLTRNLADPSLTLVHALVGISLNTAGYVLVGPTRASSLFLMALVLVLMMFRLKPAQILLAAGAGIVQMGCAMLWLRWREPEAFTAEIAWAHFGLLLSCLMTMAWIGATVSKIRLRLMEQRQQLRAAMGQVEQLATRDALTGLVNRGHMQSMLEHAVKQSTQAGIPFSVALLDVDLFKSINDTHGHRVGDEVLQRLARCVSERLRATDVMARWGGEEFLLLLPGTSVDEACLAVESVRDALAAQRLIPSLQDLVVTLSAGVAEINTNEPVDVAIERADRALYLAKERGRNCCVKAQPHLERSGAHPAYAA